MYSATVSSGVTSHKPAKELDAVNGGPRDVPVLHDVWLKKWIVVAAETEEER